MIRIVKGSIKDYKEGLKRFIEYFRVSKMQPVYIENMCINYKLYTQFIKKLKGFQITESFESDDFGRQTLVIEYQNKTTKGRFVLYDISHELESLPEIPKGELHGES